MNERALEVAVVSRESGVVKEVCLNKFDLRGLWDRTAVSSPCVQTVWADCTTVLYSKLIGLWRLPAAPHCTMMLIFLLSIKRVYPTCSPLTLFPMTSLSPCYQEQTGSSHLSSAPVWGKGQCKSKKLKNLYSLLDYAVIVTNCKQMIKRFLPFEKK